MNSSGRTLLFSVLMMNAFVPVSAKLLEDTVAVVNGTPILLSEYQKEANTALELLREYGLSLSFGDAVAVLILLADDNGRVW